MEEGLCKPPPEPAVAVELRALVQRAQSGDPSALPRIRQILDDCPQVWQHVGDIAALAERAWISVLAADNPLAVEAMKRSLAEMRADLAGAHPTRLERMMVDQVIACWLEVKYLEGTSADPGRGSLDQASLRLKRLESAQRRYLTAVRTLTDLRTLAPAVMAPADSIRLYDPERKRQRA